MYKKLGVIFISCLFIMSGCSYHKEPNEQIDKKDVITEEKGDIPTESPVSEHDEERKFIQIIYTAAKQGMIDNIPFIVGKSKIEEVKLKWGDANSIEPYGSSNYAMYNSYQASVGYTETRVFDLRSFDSKLHSLTSTVIEKELGKSTERRYNDKEEILVYKLDHQLELKFIVSKESNQVDHISVVSTSQEAANPLPYELDIKGTSNQLSAKAWNSMLGWRKSIKDFARKTQGRVFLNGPNVKRVALTFDDGPDNRNTPSIIKSLHNAGVKGSFFFIGERAEQYPEVVKQAYDNGNLVLSHSYSHVDLTTLSDSDLKTELRLTERILEKITGKKPAIIRPPYGETNSKVVTFVEGGGGRIVLWSIDTLDWSQKEYNHIVSNVMANVRNGDIILMHSDNDKGETAKAVPLLIEQLKEQDFEIVGLDSLLSIPAYQ